MPRLEVSVQKARGASARGGRVCKTGRGLLSWPGISGEGQLSNPLLRKQGAGLRHSEGVGGAVLPQGRNSGSS